MPGFILLVSLFFTSRFFGQGTEAYTASVSSLVNREFEQCQKTVMGTKDGWHGPYEREDRSVNHVSRPPEFPTQLLQLLLMRSCLPEPII